MDSDERLFTVLAALNAAGYDAAVDSPENSPVRHRVREAIAARKTPVVEEIRAYYKKHPGISQYVSLALSVDLAPEFLYRFKQDQIPPDAAALEDFRPLLTRFYEQAGIEELWKSVQPDYNRTLENLHSPITKMIFEVNGYMRQPAAEFLGRKFIVWSDLLASPGHVFSRNYGDDYFLIVTAARDVPIAEVRHAYLHFALDPLIVKYGMELKQKDALMEIALQAPALDETYKRDFALLATECLIRAVEARMTRNPARVTESAKKGFILTPYFAEKLAAYEKDVVSLKLSFEPMLQAINVTHERKRLAEIAFDKEPEIQEHRLEHAPEEPARASANLSASARRLDAAEDLYEKRDLEPARALYLKILEEPGEPAEHARAYYGLARIALLEKKPELGEKMFAKTLASSPDPQVKGWTLVYLGRLAQAAGKSAEKNGDSTEAAAEFEQAHQHFQNALEVAGISDEARTAAKLGLGGASGNPNSGEKPKD